MRILNASTAAACALLIQGLGSAHAQQITVDGIARSASLFGAIIDHCPIIVPTNVDVSRRTMRAFMEVGISMEPKDVFGKRLMAEIKRRSQEVRITGPQQWCIRQQAFVRSMPIDPAKNEPVFP